MAEVLLRGFGYEPLEPYPGMVEPWNCTCRCGRQVAVRWSNLLQGSSATRGCNWCKTSGFNFAVPAHLYLLKHEGLGCLKIGVTAEHSTRLASFRSLGWDVVTIERFERGETAATVERDVLTWWRTDLLLPPHVGPTEMPKGGWTETVASDAVDVGELIDRIRLYALHAFDADERSADGI
ncbi:hypothetical protein [Cellulomonas sp. URHE0023]|uniref:hypothetical protein n=1 Tax=Cellulomonas sp. URHE0023 TaxID=1380354 RepID=UPI0012DDA38F|nr:hypothetical protein [Cellulomonas sp. URHE0023]